MKVILLQHLSGAETHAPKDEIEVSENEALRMIEKGIAKLKTKKAQDEFLAKAEKIKADEAEKQAKIIAIQKGEELKQEATLLLDDLIAIVATVGSMEPEYKKEFVETLHEKLTELDIDGDATNENNNKGEGE